MNNVIEPSLGRTGKVDLVATDSMRAGQVEAQGRLRGVYVKTPQGWRSRLDTYGSRQVEGRGDQPSKENSARVGRKDPELKPTSHDTGGAPHVVREKRVRVDVVDTKIRRGTTNSDEESRSFSMRRSSSCSKHTSPDHVGTSEVIDRGPGRIEDLRREATPATRDPGPPTITSPKTTW